MPEQRSTSAGKRPSSSTRNGAYKTVQNTTVTKQSTNPRNSASPPKTKQNLSNGFKTAAVPSMSNNQIKTNSNSGVSMLNLGKLDQSLDTFKKNSMTNDIVLNKSGGFKTSKPQTNILKNYFSEGKMLSNVNNSHSSSVEDIRKHLLVQ